MRWNAVALTVLLMIVPAPVAEVADTAVPPCAGQAVPPAPPATAELVAPVPAPLPVPSVPVGGAGLGGCGDVVAGGALVPPGVGAASWVLADLDSGDVLAARAPHARHRPASTIKILTSLVTLRELDPDDTVEGTAADLTVEGSRAGIGPGGRYSVRLLLAGLLLNSGNDTAAALSRAVGGDAAMVDAMTATARELGALDTRPATPSGLDGPGGTSSAYDLALLFRAAMGEPLFAETIATRTVPFPGYTGMPGFQLSNSSRFLARYPGALGGKAGFTDAARHTLVAAAERDGRRLVVALMRGEQGPVPMWQQAAGLLDLGFALPADVAPVGVLVDAAPVPTAQTDTPGPPGTAAPVPADPPPPPSQVAPDVAVVLALVALGVAVLLTLLTAGPRRR